MEADTLSLVLVFIIPLIFVPFIYPKKFIEVYSGFVLFGFIGYIGANFYRKDKIRKELIADSISAIGVVEERKYRSGGKGSSYWEFRCAFEAGDSIFTTFYEKDRNNTIHKGDTLEILYLERNPEISHIVLPGND